MNVKREFDDTESLELDTSKEGESSVTYDTTAGGSANDDNIIYVKNIDQNVTTVNVISCDDMEVDGQGGEHVIEMDENGNSTAGGKYVVLVNKGSDGEQQLELVSSK